MVTQTVQQGTRLFRGVRALNAPRDLPQVALLLEEAFREDLGALHTWSRVPILREAGAVLISTAFMPVPTEHLHGYVYEDNGQIVGNVTLTLDDSRTARWLVSNVAVAEKYRRHGIARQMMQAAIDDARARSARWIILNVRPWNNAAVKLYETLGFESVDTETQYVRTRPRTFSEVQLPMRRLRDNERRDAFEVARVGMGEELRMFRPPTMSDFGVRLEDRFAERTLDFFILQSTERWGYFQGDVLTGVVSLRAQRLGTPHSMDIRVLPSARGFVERGLVAAALSKLSKFPAREIRIRVLASHPQLIEALGDAGFIPTRGLTLMAKKLRNT
jgi:ribosomal protein S18 acetylase RimI-like enzyme